MPERKRIRATRAWVWIRGVVLVIVGIFIGYRMIQTQQHLAAAQSELESTKQGFWRLADTRPDEHHVR